MFEPFELSRNVRQLMTKKNIFIVLQNIIPQTFVSAQSLHSTCSVRSCKLPQSCNEQCYELEQSKIKSLSSDGSLNVYVAGLNKKNKETLFTLWNCTVMTAILWVIFSFFFYAEVGRFWMILFIRWARLPLSIHYVSELFNRSTIERPSTCKFTDRTDWTKPGVHSAIVSRNRQLLQRWANQFRCRTSTALPNWQLHTTGEQHWVWGDGSINANHSSARRRIQWPILSTSPQRLCEWQSDSFHLPSLYNGSGRYGEAGKRIDSRHTECRRPRFVRIFYAQFEHGRTHAQWASDSTQRSWLDAWKGTAKNSAGKYHVAVA